MRRVFFALFALLFAQHAHADWIVPTAPPGTNTNQAASTAFVQAAITAAGCGASSFTAITPGCVPASGGGTTNFLRADGTWAIPTVSGGLTINSTVINSGTNLRILYDNAGTVGEYTAAQVGAFCGTFTSIAAGCVPLSGGGTANFLRADGSWAAPGLTVGTTAISGGTTTRVLFDNAGALGEYTNAQLTALCQTFSTVATTSGCVPGSNGASTANFLRADGTWSPPSGISAAQGRLTLISHTPEMSTSVTAATTIFYDCYVGGGQVPYYNGTTDQIDVISGCEVSTALQSSSTGVLNSGNVFDLFWVHSGANHLCVVTNGAGLGWAGDTGGSNTARGTGYSQIDRITRPYPTNPNILTHCYNGATDYGPVAANQGTYLGTLATSAAGTTAWTIRQSGGSGAPSKLLLWNMYNRVYVTTFSSDSNSSWAYLSATVRAADNGSTNVQFVSGLAGESIFASYMITGSTAGAASVGLAMDVTNAFDRQATFIANGGGTTKFPANPMNTYAPQVGFHQINALEQGDGANTTTFSGSSLQELVFQSRM